MARKPSDNRKICQQCGKQFTVKGSHYKQKYCSTECRDESMRKRVLVHCAYCGKAKEVPECHTKDRDKHYCNKECHRLDQYGVEPPNKVGLIGHCLVCGKEFHYSPSSQQKYCSKPCADKANGQRSRLAPRKASYTQCTCEQCGKVFEVRTNILKREGYSMGRFCSRECQVERKRHIRGENHPLKVQYIQQTCQWCGQTYESKPSEAPDSKFCSRQCQGAWAAKNMHRKETSIEASIRILLDRLGVVYIQECPIGHYTCDFLIESSRLVIECDGTYWHSIKKVITRDKRKDTYLSNKGYKVLHLSEKTIKSDIDLCRQEILKRL